MRIGAAYVAILKILLRNCSGLNRNCTVIAIQGKESASKLLFENVYIFYIFIERKYRYGRE